MMTLTKPTTIELTVFCPFNGIGIGALGFLDALPSLGNLQGKWRCLGGIDIDARANANASRLVGVPFTTLDLMSREQYIAYHDKQPPAEWREATPADVFQAAGCESPDALFLSPPCQGYSALLPEKSSKLAKYQALNELALRGVWLSLEAFKDDLPSFCILENVPRISTRGRHFLDLLTQLLQAYGYAVSEASHDCGEIGHLAQSRKRFLLVARNRAKVPDFLYQPPCRPLRAVGDVLGKLPVPVPGTVGLHRLPELAWKTWVRLACVTAGADWRSLNRLRVVDGHLADFGLLPERPYFRGGLGVQSWDEAAGTMTGRSGNPACGVFAVADPRFAGGTNEYSQYGVNRWEDSTGAMIAVKSPGQGTFSVADPRPGGGCYRMVRLDAPEAAAPLADPRFPWGENAHESKFKVGRWDEHAGTVICTTKGPGSGALSIADPRPGLTALETGRYLTAGHYGVVPWSDHSKAITGSGGHDNGANNVADPRLPAAGDKLGCIIIASDNTWHRPFTTLEVAALQSMFDPEAYADFELHGRGEQELRTWIGNAVPRAAAKAVAEQFGEALLLARTGQTKILSATPVWVQPMIAAMMCGQTAN